MSGYSGKANDFLHEFNFFDYGFPYNPTEQPHSTTKYEYDDLGSGDEMIAVANPAGGLKCQIKFSS